MQLDLTNYYDINGRTARIIRKNKGVLVQFSDGEKEWLNPKEHEFTQLIEDDIMVNINEMG